ncbi:hypothetical protein BDV33DRAFT_196808 [Aspergillus novoparasiticus]|uniref:Protein kinase domain-containing protein n=1 Tax=Aspergillus novoparasiticus TaxID=986946 RepID=A0A5N6E7Q4_9EURO|nr:hypothetical protein BDV33DRAFT_196808 [Aspergillus novoparasiticus]
MGRSSSPGYKALYLRAEEEKRKAEEERDQGRERTRPTTFLELLRLCHSLFSLQLRAESLSRSTTGKIPAPAGKYCPLRLRHWEDCATRQEKIYRSVCTYLAPAEAAAQLFLSRVVLEGFGEEFNKRAISSEQDLESYERFGIENHVRDIIAQLCKIPAAREEFGLSDGVHFDNHANALDLTEVDLSLPAVPSTSWRSRPDQFCIRRVDGDRNTLLTTVEYKPPYKLSVENLRAGLREMNFWEEVLTGSAITQEYHVMIQEGLEYSYLTNGLALVLLRVPYDEPGTLYYHLCELNMEIDLDDDQSFDQPLTAIARVLCLCLMSFAAPIRDQTWRNEARKQLPLWTTKLRQNPPSSEYSPSVSSGRVVSEYLPSSSPVESPTQRRRIPTRSRARCAPTTMEYKDSPDLDTESAPGGRKCGFSQVTSSLSSPSVQRSAHQTGTQPNQRGRYQHNAQFCVQQYLLGLQRGGTLDDRCPNVELHRQGGTNNQHLIDASGLVRRIKQQLDQNLDVDCTPMGGCRASGAPFKITCTAYGYTVVGTGTISYLWNEIRHMLLMGWGGEPIHKLEDIESIRHEISRSQKKICSLGVLHQDVRSDNMLWNAELERVLIIDFHRSHLDSRPMKKRMRLREQHSYGAEGHGRKRLRIGQ